MAQIMFGSAPPVPMSLFGLRLQQLIGPHVRYSEDCIHDGTSLWL